MAYGDRRNSGRRGGGKGNFQDSGFLSKNDYKTKDSHPSHRGKLTLSPKLLQYLNDKYENGEELEIDLSGWRKDDNPSMIKLKVQEAYVKEDDGDNRRADSGGGRSRGSVRRDDDDDDRPSRRVRSRDDDDEDRPRGRRGQLTADLDDDVPFKKSDGGSSRRHRSEDYGDESDL